MQSYWIRNADITASSILDSFHDPGNARLHGKGAWMPLVQDNKQFLQIDFKDEANVSAVALQGHPNYDDWITKFALSFSFDGKAWDDFHEVFNGSYNKDEVKTVYLPELKKLRFLRIKPTEWHGGIALRMEIYGCMKEYSRCGYRPETHSRQRRIVGGKIAQPNSWPWQVEFAEKGNNVHSCGGSIIHPRWILTAGHCADPYYNSAPKEIRLGEHDRVVLEGYEEVLDGDRFYIHPGFKHDRPSYVSPGDYDIALYHLKRPATFHSRVSPVCMPDEDSTLPEDVGRVCVVTGWGHTVEYGNFSEVLQENQVPIVSRAECNKNDSYDGYITENFMCAGFEGGGKDACQGDSGGPLVCQDDGGKWVLAGVVTWGIGCARPHKYGVYADVRRLLPFVESTMFGYPECGVRPESSQIARIVGGREAQPNSWPWQVDILRNGTAHLCGGSLIAPSWIVTSAHCFYLYNNPSQWQVRVGEHNESIYEGFEERIDIENITVHPGFRLGSYSNPGDYDIAIIKLKRPAVFHKRVHSICLPDMETSFPAGKSCFTTGWGRQNESAAEYSDVLREVEVNLVSKEVCNSNSSYQGIINERYLCAGFQEGGRDACFGDSSAPLACQIENGSYVLTGVVSWGVGCARENNYGVYLDVRFMLPFIESTLYGYPSCGLRPVPSPTSRIVGGREGIPNSWPWQVDLLLNGTAHLCGGSLIAPSWIVTSAHCFYRYNNPSQWQVRVGEHNESIYEGFEEMIDIENVTAHPGFTVGSYYDPGDYDIAIIKLKRPAVFHKRVHSICLPDMETSFPAGKSCFTTGWGKQNETAAEYSQVLREVEVNLVSRQVCNSNISYQGFINERYLCAGFQEGGRDACFGDSGGPLACQLENGSYVLTGVVSWGEGCARANKYGVYLDVRFMLPFIENTIYGHPKCGIRFSSPSTSLTRSPGEAHPYSWPWQVEVLFRNKHACSGALIDSNWVITSAACVNNSEIPAYWSVRLGEHRRTLFEGYEETIKVNDVVVDPEGHVALLKMERVGVLHQRVTTVCLPSQETTFPVNESECYVTSWTFSEQQGNLSDVLIQSQVELASVEVCNASYGGAITMYEGCVNSSLASPVCSVEKGAPLVCPGNNGQFLLAGVVSYEDWCSNPGKFGVFVHIKTMLSFIYKTTM
ncbi:transmembrane protease serine 9-like isoform X2 [Montipora foliosa]